MTDPVRLVAFHALRAVAERDAYVNLVLPAMLDEHQIEGRDAAFATELVHGTVRRQGTYDAIIDQVASKGIGSIDPPVLDALRLGTHQLLSMRVPAHAAVSTTVDVVRREIGHKPVHFANALLRKIGQKDLDGWLDRSTEGLEGDAARAVRTSHPLWIVTGVARGARRARDADRQAARRRQRAATRHPGGPPGPVAARRPARHAGLLSPYARILDEGGAPGAIPEVRDGRAGVQDEGSQLVAITLADAPGRRSDEPLARPVRRSRRQGRPARRLGGAAGRRPSLPTRSRPTAPISSARACACWTTSR